MKILFYIPKLDRGGPDRVIASLANALSHQNVTIHILVQETGGHYWQNLDSFIERSCLPLEESSTAKSAYPIRAYAAHVRSIKPDIVLSTLRSTTTSGIAKLIRQANIPLVLRPANHLSQGGRSLFKKSPLKHSISWAVKATCLHIADHIICQSQDLYDDFRRYRVPENRMSVIGNPIALPSSSILDNLPHPKLSGAPCLVAVGRLTYQKGFDILINAVNRLKNSHPDLNLYILGEGEDRPILEGQIRHLGLTRQIFLKGYTENPEAWMANADFVISSSRYEGFPNVILEALACGTPVIATNCPGGTRELVVPGLSGWLCKPESPVALAQTIAKAWNSKSLEPEKIRKFIQSNFSCQIIGQKYLDLFHRIVAEKR